MRNTRKKNIKSNKFAVFAAAILFLFFFTITLVYFNYLSSFYFSDINVDKVSYGQGISFPVRAALAEREGDDNVFLDKAKEVLETFFRENFLSMGGESYVAGGKFAVKGVSFYGDNHFNIFYSGGEDNYSAELTASENAGGKEIVKAVILTKNDLAYSFR